MNDRFKFRVWDKNNKVYFGGSYGVSYYMTDSEIDGDLYCRQCDGPFELSKDNDFIVEQCTGLKDKNGKLIYENDLVTRSLKIYRVDWCEDKLGFVLRDESKPDDTLESLDITIKTWEIIGSVHENKELLDD